MKINILKEGNFIVDKERKFIPVVPDKKPMLAVQPFLVVTESDYILLDTGLGLELDERPVITLLLEEHQIQAKQITKILLSHLHKDHIGGIGRLQEGKFIPNFPNATIFLQERELTYALEKENHPSYQTDLLKGLQSLDQLALLHEDQGKIDSVISYEVGGGHSPFHQSFLITEGMDKVFYGGDNLPQKSYLKFPSAYKNDFDGRKALELRREWEIKAKEEQWQILFYHDIHRAVVQY